MCTAVYPGWGARSVFPWWSQTSVQVTTAPDSVVPVNTGIHRWGDSLGWLIQNLWIPFWCIFYLTVSFTGRSSEQGSTSTKVSALCGVGFCKEMLVFPASWAVSGTAVLCSHLLHWASRWALTPALQEALAVHQCLFVSMPSCPAAVCKTLQ